MRPYSAGVVGQQEARAYSITDAQTVFTMSGHEPVVEKRGERLGLNVVEVHDAGHEEKEHCGGDCTNCPCGGKGK
tara:strand:+ start:260 stop:484 length:225 start_codon:yes stop_codon:yes gene_type:complete